MKLPVSTKPKNTRRTPIKKKTPAYKLVSHDSANPLSWSRMTELEGRCFRLRIGIRDFGWIEQRGNGCDWWVCVEPCTDCRPKKICSSEEQAKAELELLANEFLLELVTIPKNLRRKPFIYETQKT